LQQADHEIGRMDLLVNELLTLSRIEHQPELAGKQTVILHDVIADCVSSARVEAEVAGKQLTLALHAQAQLQGHEELLARAMDNLIRNAIRHTAAQTAVHVHFLVVDEAVELHVEDAGPGVPDALREKIFDAFFRIPATDQGTERGYGLGLALARRVAYLHGANLSAHNRLEGGLRMVMRFDGITASSISQITPLEVVAARS
jgi:two-component system, OmpR family, sensor kinase